MLKQKGFSLIQALVYLFFGISIFFMVFKVVPAYAENYSVQNILNSLGDNSALRQALPTSNPSDAITSTLITKLANNDIHDIKEDQISVVSISNGNRVTVDYDIKIPLFGNISLLIHFTDFADINLPNG